MPDKDLILLGHGGGGTLWQDLLTGVLLPSFPDVQTADGAVLPPTGDRALVFTTDSFVVEPLFFCGGDIGSLAVHGTVNDLAMMGAEPFFLSCSLVMEEGFSIASLASICRSMQAAAGRIGVKIVTGDTKVVGHGAADGIFINTAGIGLAVAGYRPSPARVRSDDAVIVCGGLGEHGTAILAQRLGIEFQPPLPTDSAPLWPQVETLLAAGIRPRVMRDLTRGGLAGAACELAADGGFDMVLFERDLPVDQRVAKACEVWGIDPFSVAGEGCFMAIVDAVEAQTAVKILHKFRPGASSAVVGRTATGNGRVTLMTKAGGKRTLRPLTDEMLPRIC